MDLTFFTFIWCKKWKKCLKRSKINEKEAEVGPFFFKKERSLLLGLFSRHENWVSVVPICMMVVGGFYGEKVLKNQKIEEQLLTMWPDWPIFERSWQQNLLSKVPHKHWLLFVLFWKASLNIKTSVVSIWATFGNIWAIIFTPNLVTLAASSIWK